MNQLSGIPDKFIAYGYDALDRRVRKTVGEDVYTYVWVGKQMVEEHGPDGVRKFVYGDGVDEPVCMVEPDGGIYYFHRGIGKSVIALSDESGAVVETYAYTPFGKPSVNETGGMPKSPFLFAGRWYEPDAGIYYYRARYYHPELRKFLQPDPLGYEDGMNMYAYVHNNPVNYYDPNGMDTAGLNCSLTIGCGNYYTIGASFFWDDHDDWSIMTNTGYGYFGGATANLSLQYQQTNAQSVSDLNGSSIVYGGSASFLTVERIVGSGYTGFSIGAAVGPDAGGSAYFGHDYGSTAYTTVHTSELSSSYDRS